MPPATPSPNALPASDADHFSRVAKLLDQNDCRNDALRVSVLGVYGVFVCSGQDSKTPVLYIGKSRVEATAGTHVADAEGLQRVINQFWGQNTFTADQLLATIETALGEDTPPSSAFNQTGQTVYGSQTNIRGNVGTIVMGDMNNVSHVAIGHGAHAGLSFSPQAQPIAQKTAVADNAMQLSGVTMSSVNAQGRDVVVKPGATVMGSISNAHDVIVEPSATVMGSISCHTCTNNGSVYGAIQQS